eukprot:12309012-Heterocapsa_arctica.AAC.1
MMHKGKFEQHMKNEGRKAEIETEWQRLLDETPVGEKDFKGPVRQEERVPVTIEDFVVRENASGSRNERECQTKDKKNPTAKDSKPLYYYYELP